MGSFEAILLTIGIVIVDLLILKEYLRLEEELNRVKQITPLSETEMQSMAQEVVAPLSQPTESAVVFSEEAKRNVERENEALKTKNEVLLAAKTEFHVKQLDALATKINEVLQGVKQVKGTNA